MALLACATAPGRPLRHLAHSNAIGWHESNRRTASRIPRNEPPCHLENGRQADLLNSVLAWCGCACFL